MNEAETRAKFLDPKLKTIGWVEIAVNNANHWSGLQ
jgi:hypothetical protein